QNLSITVVNDGLDENDETIQVTLNPTNATLGAISTYTYTILDDDPPPSLSLSNVTVTEGNSGNTMARFAATLSIASGKTVTVDLGFSGTATLTSDYTRSGTSIVIAPGSTTGTITLTAVQDSLDENNETIIVDIASVTNGTESGTQQVTAIITDDDPTPTVAFTADSSSGLESVSPVTLAVSLSAASGRTVTVGYSVN